MISHFVVASVLPLLTELGCSGDPPIDLVLDLFTAVRSRDVAKVRQVLAQGDYANARFGDRDEDILKGADGGWPTYSNEFTPIRALAISRTTSTRADESQVQAAELAIAGLLLRHGARLDESDPGGGFAFSDAVSAGNDQLAKFFLLTLYSQGSPSMPPRLLGCFPNVPSTLETALNLSGEIEDSEALHLCFHSCIYHKDVDSMLLLLAHSSGHKLDRALLRRFREKFGDGRFASPRVKLAELQLRSRLEVVGDRQ